MSSDVRGSPLDAGESYASARQESNETIAGTRLPQGAWRRTLWCRWRVGLIMSRSTRARSVLTRIAILILLAGLATLAVQSALAWLARHPEHDPRAPLTIAQREGWATPAKLADLRDGGPACRAVLERSDLSFTALEPAGEGACRREDRLRLADGAVDFRPATPVATCAVHAALAWWLEHRVQRAAEAHLGQRVARIEHLGTASCRRVNGAATGAWSEHATGNAIDISAFVLADGTRISLLRDWPAGDAKAAFLRAARDGACDVFGTTLSPDYNALHADHFHLDQAARGIGGFCR